MSHWFWYFREDQTLHIKKYIIIKRYLIIAIGVVDGLIDLIDQKKYTADK